MIEGNEVAPGVWLFSSDTPAHNFGIVVASSNFGGGAILVDPGNLPEQINAQVRFLAEHNSTLGLVVFTKEPLTSTKKEPHWDSAPVVSPFSEPKAATAALPQGWQAVLLSPGRLGLYNIKQRILFFGDMLPQGKIPALKGSAQSYLDALETLEKLDVKIALPARGGPAKGKREVRTRIESDRSYIMATMRHVVTSMAAGITPVRAEEVARAIYEDYPFVEEHIANVRTLWQELANAGS
ncbi:MAG: hypothetical protein M3014_10905 [Chloroflexota bacterium]|nr:hypothetical protein [Chloroflexota bacterium]